MVQAIIEIFGGILFELFVRVLLWIFLFPILWLVSLPIILVIALFRRGRYLEQIGSMIVSVNQFWSDCGLLLLSA